MKRVLSTGLVAVLMMLVLTALPNGAVACVPSPEAPLAVVGAGSDFQYLVRDYNGVTYDDIHTANAVVMEQLLQSMKADHPALDDYFLLGDYDAWEYTAATSGDGLKAACGALEKVYGLRTEQILALQGNHDPADTPGLAATGDYDREHYGVYLINEDDFPWCGGNPDQTRSTASKLKAYLDEKLQQGWTKPVFVLNHLPLHHSHRVGSGQDIADNRYAQYLVDVLNEAGQQGLQIIFLFGHNHSGSYDSYLGGDCVCLTPGQTMYVTDPVKGTLSDYRQVMLHFTYLNAGYLGYVNGDRTSTVFKIYEDRVELYRYRTEGLCSLKNPGISHMEDLGWEADPSRIDSPWICNLSPIRLQVLTNTLEDRLHPGKSARICIDPKGADTLIWESLNSSIVSVVADGSDPACATVTGVGYGTTQVKVTAHRGDEVPAVLYMDVTVVNEGVQMPQNRGSELYRLVTDWTELEVDGRYLIMNTNAVGTGVALGGAAVPEDRVKDPMLLNTAPGIFQLPEDPGVYTTTVTGTEVWQLLPASDGTYVLGRTGTTPGYLAATSQVDSDHLIYSYSGAYRIASSDHSDGVIHFRIDKESKALTFTQVYDEESKSLLTVPEHILTYDERGYFQVCPPSEGSDRVALYRQTQMQMPSMWLWVEGTGLLPEPDVPVTEAYVAAMIDGVVFRMPITVDMLNMEPLNCYIPGDYQCTVTYGNQVLSDSFSLTVPQPDGTRTDTQLLQLEDEQYYLLGGKVAQRTGLVKYQGQWYYLEQGRVRKEVTGFVWYQQEQFYVNEGRVLSDYTGLMKVQEQWYYLVKGKLAAKTGGLIKIQGSWYYLLQGRVAREYSGLVKHYGSWYYIKNGKLAKESTTLVKYGGEWFYVVDGKLSSQTTTLVFFNGGWYYVYKGKVADRTTTLVKYCGVWYYVKSGKVDFTYSGPFYFCYHTYTVKNGSVVSIRYNIQ